MNVFARRTPPPMGQELGDEPLQVPKFLAGEASMEERVAHLPHPVKSNPLTPAVAELLDRAIMERGEAYVRIVLTRYERRFQRAKELLEQVNIWADNERARHREQAATVAEDGEEMMREIAQFQALPRAPQTLTITGDDAGAE